MKTGPSFKKTAKETRGETKKRGNGPKGNVSKITLMRWASFIQYTNYKKWYKVIILHEEKSIYGINLKLNQSKIELLFCVTYPITGGQSG